MKKRKNKKFHPESQLYDESDFHREAEFYREALNFVLKNIDKNCVKERKIEKGLEEIRREYYK